MRRSLGLLSLLVGCLFMQELNVGRAAEPPTGHVYTPPTADPPSVAAASDQGKRQIASFKVADGLKVKLWAAEPMVANPVCISVDEHGRIYVGETYRIHHGVDDDRGHMDWLDDDMASKTVEDRLALMKKHLGKNIDQYTKQEDRIRLLEDRSGGGKADHVEIFADGFNGVLQGIGAGLLARHGDVYYTCIPDLWRLRDTKGTGHADVRESLSYGYGVRVSFLGHDLHGLKFGPDGKLYYTLGDRAFSVKTGDHTIANSETGAVFRCNADGSDVEVFSYGVRNPQKLAFDEFGNLFTCDNNSDSGDRARWVYLVEGGDTGWRMPYQYLNDRGPFNREKIWYPPFEGQAAYIVPPVAWLADGPSGLVYYPGTGWDDKWQGHFFLCDFRGSPGGSGVRSLAVKPKGASFEMVDSQEFLWHILCTDVDWSPEGSLCVTDWVDGWDGCGKGRIYKVYSPATQNDPVVLEVKQMIAEGMTGRPIAELMRLLSHADMRIRQEAQFELAARAIAGKAGDIVPRLIAQAIDTRDGAAKLKRLSRIHAIWALGQIGRHSPKEALAPLVNLAADADPEIRAQTAKVLGDDRYADSFDKLLPLLKDNSLRVRHLAAIAIGKLGRPEAIAPALEMLRENDDKDAVVRHSAVMALVGSGNSASIMSAGAFDNSPAVRMGVLLALRRIGEPAIAKFLLDPDPRLVLEAARAIHDLPIESAEPALALLSDNRSITSDATRAAISKDFDGRDALLRRVLNANFRLGTAENAAAVARFAARTDAPEAMRIEALEMLADWAKPSGHDRVINAWRPLEPRSAEVAIAALRPALGGICSGSNRVRQVAAKVAGQLGIKEIVPVLLEMAADTGRPAAVRVQAMAALEQLRDARVNATVATALKDSEPAVRSEARRILADLRPTEAIGPLEDALSNGTHSEQQAALATLGTIKAPQAANRILSQWFDKLLADRAPRELQLDLLEAAAHRGSPALKEQLVRFESARPKKDSIDPFRETLYGGDAQRGRTIFFDRAEVGCVRCHTVSGIGGKVGPDLTKIGAEKTREYLLESVVDPNKVIAKGFETVVLALDDGRQIAGILKSEEAKELTLMTPEGKLVTIEKSRIDSRTTGKSAMPQDIAKPLSKSDLRDLVEFLSGLKR
jgi:quinoprotein glucose dehydrogenase